MKRLHLLAAWLAITALLIDGLLPTAVSAAAMSPASPLPLCSAAATGNSLPDRAPQSLPTRHCTLCAVCAGCPLGLFPHSVSGGLIVRISGGAAHPIITPSATINRRAAYITAQPRAPPPETARNSS
ncbi:MAG TPA: hypothetical protein VME45_03675 [Stellaceae bacterium]|nr:hypothetical protein [Stellaceae bacterium]